ncbi:MAG: hypothetical protein A3K68_08020 [Euryarchaeota archaeon RBG_16_68_13]|nr:MAG: hypothetical protein A3K68_08020 [Euryarchaeota archaeon RBG_16_68_13]
MLRRPAGNATRTAVFRLAWPVMLANLLQTLTTTIDVILVGSLGDGAGSAVAAVGLGGQFLFLFFSVMIAVSAGTIALIARAVGAKDGALADHVLKQSLVLGAFLSVPLTLVGLFGSGPVLTLMGARADVVSQAAGYIQIVSLTVFFQFIAFLGNSALRGAGDTRTPLVIGVLVNVVNFLLAVNLVFGSPLAPRLEVMGAAIATGLSYVLGAGAFLFVFLRGRGTLRLSVRGRWVDITTVRRVFRIGWPAALEQIMLQVAFFIWVAMVVGYGTEILAAHQIGLRIQMFAFMPGFGFAIAATALVGQNLGRKDSAEAERSGWEAARLSVAVMGATAAFLFVAAPWVARAFIGDPVVIEWAVTFIRIHAMSIPAVGVFFAIDGALRGAGDTRFPLLASLSGIYVIRLPLSALLGFLLGFGIVGVWIPLVIEYWYRAFVISNHFRRGRWKTLRV